MSIVSIHSLNIYRGKDNYIARIHTSVKYCICRLIYRSSNYTFVYCKCVINDCRIDYMSNSYKYEGGRYGIRNINIVNIYYYIIKRTNLQFCNFCCFSWKISFLMSNVFYCYLFFVNVHFVNRLKSYRFSTRARDRINVL